MAPLPVRPFARLLLPVGLCAAMPCTALASLMAAWAPIQASLGALSARFSNKPVVFTEIGYCANSGSNVNPAQCARECPTSYAHGAAQTRKTTPCATASTGNARHGTRSKPSTDSPGPAQPTHPRATYSRNGAGGWGGGRGMCC